MRIAALLLVLGAAYALAQLWLPRSAHAAFVATLYARAARRYRVLAFISPSRERRRASRLSLAGCAVAGGHLADAARLLAAFDEQALAPAERAVWLNNRAWLALEVDPVDARTALELAESASALRPDVPAIQHTRARALLAADRIDDAITLLDAMRSGGELTASVEADRCRSLALAWDRKGEPEYAADYRARTPSVVVP